MSVAGKQRDTGVRHDGGMIRRLPKVVPAPPGKPVREGAEQGQERARRLALRPGTWDALGRGAPFFVPTEILTEAMTAATGQSWDATESQAHWGSWAVLRPASPLQPASARSRRPQGAPITQFRIPQPAPPNCTSHAQISVSLRGCTETQLALGNDHPAGLRPRWRSPWLQSDHTASARSFAVTSDVRPARGPERAVPRPAQLRGTSPRRRGATSAGS